MLTTTAFAERLEALRELGVEVEVLEEPEFERLGMRMLLAVGQGSDSPSKVVVMQWKGGGDTCAGRAARQGRGLRHRRHLDQARPQGMEEMTMDMGGAGVVAGVMRHAGAAQGTRERRRAWSGSWRTCLAARPSARATSCAMKGDTVEVINTDAEGRLVLADVIGRKGEL